MQRRPVPRAHLIHLPEKTFLVHRYDRLAVTPSGAPSSSNSPASSMG
jgi:hypothetical protein